MAQRLATPQGTKRRYPGFSSPPGLHAEESEPRRPPYPPPASASMGGLQAPQVGVAVVTIDMFREFQRQIATTFDLHGKQIVALQERVQSIEGRVQSLEDAEDLAIDAVREIRDSVMPRVQQHGESLETLTAAVTRQNTIVDALGSLGQEFRANQSRDAVRPGQLAWRPGPLGGATDQTKSTLDELKTQLTRSFASLAEHDRRLGENDGRLSAHERHLTEHERRFAEHDKGLAAYDRHLGDHSTRLGAHDRHFVEHDARLGAHERHLIEHDAGLGKHSGHLGALDKANELVSLAYSRRKLTKFLD
ncbi:hypothetical protein HD806DRAFT_19366 [Xylariaceae sp. AK1471]|nr:hypothetical protein HD806DRAFT_19366 [Xylariaceae sp. AK1471]